jgi:uracil-DNA glycosylase
MPLPPVPPEDLRGEARLYLEWARGAAGRWLPGEAPAPRVAVDPRRPSVLPHFPGAEPSGADPARWERLQTDVAACARCGLCATRTQTVFGSGSRTPRLVVVGEAPGFEEDRQGQPFVGPAGELLTRMLAAIGLSRAEDVYILNVLKCRPPENRSPRPDEVAACKPYLREQLEMLGPPLLLALGNHAAKALLGTERGITSLRGRFTTTPEGWRVMPTFHPAYLLRNPDAKREVWDDLKKVAQDLGLAVPGK